MKAKNVLFIFLISLIGCQPQVVDYNVTIEIVEDYSEVEDRLENGEDTLWVVNFWATSCPPCVKEMPYFNDLYDNTKGEKLKILLVSLDRARDLEKRVYPFVEKYGIRPEVVVLEDQNYSKWTAKVDTSWFGALPATLILKGQRRKFQFGVYESYEDLMRDVEEVKGYTN